MKIIDEMKNMILFFCLIFYVYQQQVGYENH